MSHRQAVSLGYCFLFYTCKIKIGFIVPYFIYHKDLIFVVYTFPGNSQTFSKKYSSNCYKIDHCIRLYVHFILRNDYNYFVLFKFKKLVFFSMPLFWEIALAKVVKSFWMTFSWTAKATHCLIWIFNLSTVACECVSANGFKPCWQIELVIFLSFAPGNSFSMLRLVTW